MGGSQGFLLWMERCVIPEHKAIWPHTLLPTQYPVYFLVYCPECAVEAFLSEIHPNEGLLQLRFSIQAKCNASRLFEIIFACR